MTTRNHAARGLAVVAAQIALAAMILFALPTVAVGQEKATLFATTEDGYGRLVLTFPQRLDLPPYRLNSENGVLSIVFDEPVDLALSDVAVAMPQWISIARMDPDRRGVRFGLRRALAVNPMEAGERLFIDLLPEGWQGLPPSLPTSVIEELSERARNAAIVAERERKAEQARTLRPEAQLRVGRAPTVMRLSFRWNVPSEGTYRTGEQGEAIIDFGWPVAMDLTALQADLPAEVTGAVNEVTQDGTSVVINVAPGVQPRFYALSETEFILDIDIAGEDAGPINSAAIEALENLVPRPAQPTPQVEPVVTAAPVQAEITPSVALVGDTVRVIFPFDRDIASAAFRRGGTLWILFDTMTRVNQPDDGSPLSEIATNLSTVSLGDTQIVRMDFADGRLATLGAEGRSWVLSIGDVLLNPTAPLNLTRERNETGSYQVSIPLARPGRLHEFRDPIVGDVLKVVTAMAPAEGLMRTLAHVDFTALPSVHGLVVRPQTEGLAVAVDTVGARVVITSREGLTLSPADSGKPTTPQLSAADRTAFVDLVRRRASDLRDYNQRLTRLLGEASQAEGASRDQARLELAQFYIANQFSYEAIGVLRVFAEDAAADETVQRPARLALAVANALAGRGEEALGTLNSPIFTDEPDAALWRTIIHANRGEYSAARQNALAAEGVIGSYPLWVRQAFLFAAVRGAVETSDVALARRLLGQIEFARLDAEQGTWYHLFAARIAEAEGHPDEALDTYGQVIAADIRPTRAEAVYRTILLLDGRGRLDAARATQTLAAEALMWRDGPLELRMQKLLAELYFRAHAYRDGFTTVRQTVAYYPQGPISDELATTSQKVFGELFLDGAADALDPIEALALYYDFRQLTPPGARGDEMIRNLAQRLVRVDLLTQAADLLQYQVEARLQGAARAQVAADLAIIRIANREPRAALAVLNATRIPDLSPQLERQRRILEARAFIDTNRSDLALDLLAPVSGRDATLLRIEAQWSGGKYAAAAELLETMYAPGDAAALADRAARMNVIRAAVGYVMADDRIGLSRIRGKFAEPMALTPEWPMFDFVTREVSPQSIEFRRVAREVSGIDSLNAFLDTYRGIYRDAAGTVPAAAAATRADM